MPGSEFEEGASSQTAHLPLNSLHPKDCVSIWSRGMFVRIRFPQLGYIFSNYSQLGQQAQIVGRLLPSCLLLQPAAGVWSLCTLHSFHYAQCTLKYAHVSTKSRCWITTHTHFEKCRRAKEFTIWNMIWADAGLLYTLCTMHNGLVSNSTSRCWITMQQRDGSMAALSKQTAILPNYWLASAYYLKPGRAGKK